MINIFNDKIPSEIQVTFNSRTELMLCVSVRDFKWNLGEYDFVIHI